MKSVGVNDDVDVDEPAGVSDGVVDVLLVAELLVSV